MALVVVVAARRPLARWVRDLWRLLTGHRAWGETLLGLAILLAALASLLLFRDRAALVAAVLLAVGLGGDALDRRSAVSARR